MDGSLDDIDDREARTLEVAGGLCRILGIASRRVYLYFYSNTPKVPYLPYCTHIWTLGVHPICC